MKKLQSYNVFIALGMLLAVAGYVVYDNKFVWGMGGIFVTFGLIGRFGKKE